MNTWPDGWDDGADGRQRRPRGASGGRDDRGYGGADGGGVPDADPTQVLPHTSAGGAGAGGAGGAGAQGGWPVMDEGRAGVRRERGYGAGGYGSNPDAEPTQVLPHNRVPHSRRPVDAPVRAPGAAGQAALPPHLSPRGGAPAGGTATAPRPAGPGGPGRTGTAVASAGGGGGGPRRVRITPRRAGQAVAAVLALLLVAGIGTYFWANGRIVREPVLADYGDRPPEGEGTNWLIVGSDSREGLSEEEMDELRTGSASGKRTDSMMVLHVGDNGNTLLSLPRDSYVTIPEWTDSEGNAHAGGADKLNAAFAYGGGALLVQTVEYNTGLRIDHYAEVGFGGFVGIIDAVGGVDMCLEQAIKDEKSGADLQAGCQTLDGADSLAYVRARYFDPTGDFGRMQRQQQLLSALSDKATSPGTLLNPFRAFPMMTAGLDSLVVDDDTQLFHMYQLFTGMRSVSGGDGTRMTVPIANPDYRPGGVGSAVQWDMEQANRLFDALAADQPVPADLKPEQE
ncbi:LCP family protein [Allostreptomyces psammosilenae]|uniref:LCP family protein required for cell wall assembly n=1 Tax=Allostreptomyces psammosilenae TaxID=1892865 RepID=A0A852ZY21_9ACTN|nr:LCP family protein [Allostreptomyces psammosilenae]NYI06140.1 LCP family protein required for cell wall assembly [Allostreptomyces psammosilenae]